MEHAAVGMPEYVMEHAAVGMPEYAMFAGNAR
jgi:hypothetical protein